MKKAIFTFMLAALLVLTACATGNETATETPLPTIEIVGIEVTPTPTAGDNGEVTLPEGSFDRQFSGFWDDNGGWFIGCENNIGGNFTNNRHYIYLTSDGGVTWAETGNLNDLWTTPVTCSLFINDSVGLLGFQYDFEFTGPVYRTEDGGKTWTELDIPTFKEVKSRYWQREPIEIREVDGHIEITYLVSTSNYGDAGILYTASSTDMGKTWGPFTQSGETAGTIPTGSFDSHLMYYSNFNTGWFIGSKVLDDASKYQHYLYRTDDRGKTWTEVSNLVDYSTEPLTFVFFQNDTLGFVGFHYTADEPGKVFRTEDGGMTWVEEDISALYAVPGYNHRAYPYEVRNWGDTLGLEYFVYTSETGDTGLMYLSFSEDWVSWSAFELKPER